MNEHIKDLIKQNKNLKFEIKYAIYHLEKEMKENNLIIKSLKELSKLFGSDSITYNIGNSVNSDSELLKDYKLNIPINTSGVKYKLYNDLDCISYIFYYNIKGKLILLEEYEIYNDDCYWLDYKKFKGMFSARISDYSIFSTKKVIENKILKRINNCCNKIADHCIKNQIEIGSENCLRIVFSGYNEEFFSDYQEKYFKTLALFE